MNKHLQTILNSIQQSMHLSIDEKNILLKAVKDADKEMEITAFKLDRTEKVKRTTGILLEETIEELEQKRKAVEAQNRELGIESSLERVRTVAMSMNKRDDMLQVCRVISEQLQNLNVQEIRNVQTAIFYETNGTYINYEFYTKHDKTLITEVEYKNHAVQNGFAEQMLKGPNEIFIHSFNEKEVQDWYEFQKTTNVFLDTYLETADSLNYYWYSLGPVALGISTYKPLNEEETNLFKRFVKVFELSYRRYLDIEKAEEQAREGQIQLALERVRARTMAMQKSDELSDAVFILFQQFKELGENPDQATIGIINEDEKVIEYWVTMYGQPINKVFKFSLDELNVTNKIYTAWKENKKSLMIDLSGDALTEFMTYRAGKGGAAISPDEKRRIINVAFFSKGLLNVQSKEERSEESIKLLERFASVFEQTYTRFLDLQKAEAQAIESQIEASLERVRSRSMGMQKSEELKEVIQVVYEQFVYLNINVEHTGFIMDYKERDDMHIWLADKHAVPFQVSIPYFDCAHWNSYNEAKEKGIDFFVNHLSFEEKNKFYQDLFELIPGVPEETLEYYLSCPGLAISTVLLDNIGLYIENFSGTPYSDEENNTLMRFGKVFQQTYTRFLDLQKAEVQAKEAIRQASLDRVRGQIASMRSTEDLQRITPLIWHELTSLDVPFIRCGVLIIDEAKAEAHIYLSSPDGHSLAAMNLLLQSNTLTANSVNYWRKGLVYTEHWSQEDFVNWMQSMIEQGQVQNPETYQGAAKPPESLHLHFVPFTQGMLYVGNVTLLTDDEVDLVKSLAEAFSIAYARYEDFTKLEKAKQSIEVTLTELKATQTQLIQSEKMASLGELTAGIAHEIQNPLNFVNNFSEVSKELLDEMKTELDNGNADDAKEIANDVIQNLEKINHHGKRADAIVKGMLQHSRSSTGVKEPTDINALADEYLRLTYHGLRAKDKSFNATVKTDFEAGLEKVNIMPQDIGRVILNLITNAFYAVTEKKNAFLHSSGQAGTEGQSYEPTVTVSTKQNDGTVEIKVADNGNGIPQKVLDKIFQPFFTTKPTGQGTGLGLSLSYDIVKAHGGEIKVESKEGEETTFIIQLPFC